MEPKIAHSLKSSSTSIGALAVTEILNQMQTMPELTFHTGQAARFVDQLEFEAARALDELHLWRKRGNVTV